MSKEQITDSTSLKKVGNAIADELEIRRPARWTFRIKEGQDWTEGRCWRLPWVNKYFITIIQGTEPYEIAHQELVDWFWANNALKVKIGDKVLPDQEMIKRVIIHELTHVEQWMEGKAGGGAHGPLFAKKIQENIIRVI